jgi:uncharacterized protein (TIGR02147 family)
MRVFEFAHYIEFIKAKLGSTPNHGKGELAKIARHVGVNASFISQVLSGSKNLSAEQAFHIADFFGLDELEKKYFIELTNLSRTTNVKFKKFIREQLQTLREAALLTDGIATDDQPMDERSQAIFYSSWAYSAVQLLVGVDGFQTPRTVAQRLGIDDGSGSQEMVHFRRYDGVHGEMDMVHGFQSA